MKERIPAFAQGEPYVYRGGDFALTTEQDYQLQLASRELADIIPMYAHRVAIESDKNDKHLVDDTFVTRDEALVFGTGYTHFDFCCTRSSDGSIEELKIALHKPGGIVLDIVVDSEAEVSLHGELSEDLHFPFDKHMVLQYLQRLLQRRNRPPTDIWTSLLRLLPGKNYMVMYDYEEEREIHYPELEIANSELAASSVDISDRSMTTVSLTQKYLEGKKVNELLDVRVGSSQQIINPIGWHDEEFYGSNAMRTAQEYSFSIKLSSRSYDIQRATYYCGIESIQNMDSNTLKWYENKLLGLFAHQAVADVILPTQSTDGSNGAVLGRMGPNERITLQSAEEYVRVMLKALKTIGLNK